MGLKFRRGTTAQKSGSLAFGEPYVNTDLNTLQVGGANGDILLAAAGTSSVFVGSSVSASSWVSASSLHVTGNANVGGDLTIAGKIQIGDNASDTVNVVASLSSSLIPSLDNTFDLGSTSKVWRDLYISTGSIKIVSGGSVVTTLSSTSDGIQVNSGDIIVADDANTGVRIGKGTGDNSFNTIVGYAALNRNTTGQQNTAVGNGASSLNTTGERNTTLGAQAAVWNSVGNNNTIVGVYANHYNQSGSQNTIIGSEALFNNRGFQNTAVGYKTLYNNTYGGGNTALGEQAARFVSGSSNNNLYLGFNAGPTASKEENYKLYIDTQATNNPLIGGDFNQRKINVDGDVIPATSNTRDLGSIDKFWRDLYISTGSIKMVSNGVVVSTLSNTGNGMLLDQGIVANGNSSFGTSSAAVTSVTGSLNVSGSVSVIGALSASTITGIGNVSLYSSSVASRLTAAEAFSSSLDTTFATDASVTALSSSVKLVTDTFATSASVASATAASITTLSSSVFLVDATQTTNITTAQNSAAGAFASASAYSASAAVIDNGQDVLIGSLRTNILSASVYNTFSTSVASRVNTLETAGYAVSSSVAAATAASITTLSSSVAASGFAVSSSVASATAASITSLSSSVKAVTDTFATSASVASATAASISTLSGSVKGVTDALSGRVTTLEAKDISVTLTGDVTGTGTITDLGNVSFATTIAANSVALGTDTTGDYVASLVQGTGVTITNNSGEGATPTISIGQAVATNSAVAFASVSATGDIVAYSGSDKRLKNNIINISDAVTKVRKLNGVTWKWNDDVNEVTKTAPTTGLIAQEVQEVLPEVVNEREDGYLGIDYSKMVGLLVEAIKEQQNQIDSLTIEIENLKKNNSL